MRAAKAAVIFILTGCFSVDYGGLKQTVQSKSSLLGVVAWALTDDVCWCLLMRFCVCRIAVRYRRDSSLSHARGRTTAHITLTL